MNQEWARANLAQFRWLCERYQQARAGETEASWDQVQSLADAITELSPTVRRIARELDPALVEAVHGPTSESGVEEPMEAVLLALGTLKGMEEWEANIGPDGPVLVADQLHERIWRSASAVWSIGQYRVAVAQATLGLSGHIAHQARSQMTEGALVKHVFSPNEPGENQVRLHLPGDKSADTWKSRQQGLHLLAQGAFAGIRNVATHTEEEWPEQVALERLAVLSVIARWTDETELVQG